MSTDTLTEVFEERLQEINTYLDLLAHLEQEVQSGPPKIGRSTITVQQQRILYSSLYLQLYSLVEATANWCLDAVSHAAALEGKWKPTDLSAQLRREWVRTTARTNTDLNPENRLHATLQCCNFLFEALPLSGWAVDKGGGGNWDDTELESISSRLGFQLQVSPAVYSKIKRTIRDDKRPLALVRYFRNRLAHGDLSFSECGENVTVSELTETKEMIADYLREVVVAFRAFIDGHHFLDPSRRPGGNQ